MCSEMSTRFFALGFDPIEKSDRVAFLEGILIQFNTMINCDFPTPFGELTGYVSGNLKIIYFSASDHWLKEQVALPSR